MKHNSVAGTDDLHGNRSNRAAPEDNLKQRKAETLEWISVSALARLRVAWAR